MSSLGKSKREVEKVKMTRGKRVSYRCQDAGTQKDKFICKNTGTDTGTWVRNELVQVNCVCHTLVSWSWGGGALPLS